MWFYATPRFSIIVAVSSFRVAAPAALGHGSSAPLMSWNKDVTMFSDLWQWTFRRQPRTDWKQGWGAYPHISMWQLPIYLRWFLWESAQIHPSFVNPIFNSLPNSLIKDKYILSSLVSLWFLGKPIFLITSGRVLISGCFVCNYGRKVHCRSEINNVS